MEKIVVLAITKNGIKIGQDLKEMFPEWNIFAPLKFSASNNNEDKIIWYSEPTSEKISELFKNNNALICLFSLGAVIRLIAPHLGNKKTDPAVIVIDDKTNFVISVLSGHVGGANEMTLNIANRLKAIPVITTAADVNKTIAVDLVGREFGWLIDNDSAVTSVSAHMINEEPIGVLQEVGRRDWYKKLPKNVSIYDNLSDMKNSNSKAYLIITDKIINVKLDMDHVVYRPQSLVIGIGLHQDTTSEKIKRGIDTCLQKFEYSIKSVVKFASIEKPQKVQGLITAGKEYGIEIEYVDRNKLNQISTPNPSNIVKSFEGTASVSEAAAITLSNGGDLVVEKQKFPPDLTIAIARITN